MAKDSQERQSAASHFMPQWFEAFRTRYVLTCLIIAQWITTTIMVVMVSVSNPGEPWTWTWLDVSNLIIAVLLGGAAAGVSLALSASMAEAFGSGHAFKGIFCFVGMSGLFAADVWAGMSERSVEAHPTNADTFLANVTNFDALKVIPPSVFFVSFLLAALVLYYGWTNRPPVIEPEEAAAARRRKELADAQHKAALRSVKAGGLGQMIGANLRAGKDALSAKETSDPISGNNGGLSQHNPGFMDGSPSEYGDAPDQAASNVTPLRTKGKGNLWTADELIAHVLDRYGYRLGRGEAVAYIKAMSNATQLDGLPGKPWAAHRQTVQAWARKRTWPSQGEVTA